MNVTSTRASDRIMLRNRLARMTSGLIPSTMASLGLRDGAFTNAAPPRGLLANHVAHPRRLVVAGRLPEFPVDRRLARLQRAIHRFGRFTWFDRHVIAAPCRCALGHELGF